MHGVCCLPDGGNGVRRGPRGHGSEERALTRTELAIRIGAATVVAVGLASCSSGQRFSPLGASPMVLRDLTVCEVDGVRLGGDLIRPAKTAHLRRGVLLVHGGGWSTGGRADYEYLLQSLGGAGFTALTIDYRLAPAVRHPSHVEDAKCALRWLRSSATDLDLDADRLAVIGGSAGAHIAAFLAYTPDDPRFEGSGAPSEGGSRLAAAVLHGGPNDLTQYATFSPEQQGAVRALLGTPAPTMEQLSGASPRGFVGTGSIPTLILHGANDATVPVAQALGLDTALTSFGVPHRLVVIPDAGHSDFGADPDLVGREVLAFLRQQLDL